MTRCARCGWRGETLSEHAAETGHPLCVVCGRRSLQEFEALTCALCVGSVRAGLADIAYGLSILEPATYPRTSGPTDSTRTDDDPLLGGDALALDGPGGLGWRTSSRRVSRTSTSRGTVHYPEMPCTDPEAPPHPAWTSADVVADGREHKGDNWPTDTPAVLAELASWEDDWRQLFGDEAGPRVTVTGVIGYLNRNLDTGHRAAQTHQAFDEFAARIRELSGAVNAVTRHRPEVSVERRTCIDCGGDLERVIYDLDRPVPDRLQAAAERIAADDEVLRRKPDARVPDPRDVVRRELTGDMNDGRLQSWECRHCHKTYNREAFWNAVRQRMQNDRAAKEAAAG